MAWIAALLFSFIGTQAGTVPTVDGRTDDVEWAGATTSEMTGGGRVRMLTRGEFVHIAVEGPRAGLASLCAAKGTTVRILHASAAIGEARYERGGDTWKQTAGFSFTLRDAPRGSRPTAAEIADYLRSAGWVANSSASGSAAREFQIRAADVDALGVTFLATTDPMAMSYWPATIADDCRSVPMAQGNLPATASFDPSTWHPIQR
jgi:hypothetical protein